MRKQAIIHVGAHKTGSTSIQAYVEQNSSLLHQHGVAFYAGEYLASNHVELHLASMRTHRQSPFKMDRGIVVTDDYRRQVRERIHAFFERSTAGRLLFSSEGLSYLRYPDEMQRLQSLFPTSQITIIFYLREPTAFLESYRKQLSRHCLPATIEPDSYAYTGPDSWLANFPERIANFVDAFGTENVKVIDYDLEMKTRRNVIPSFIRALDLEEALQTTSCSSFFLNASHSADACSVQT